MDATTEPGAAPSRPRAVPSMRFLVLLAVVSSAGAGLVVEQLLSFVVPIPRPFDLLASVGVACLVGVRLVGLAISALTRDRAELQGRYDEAVADALRDPLTSLGNHRAFQEELERQVEHAQRYGVPVSLVVIDIDDFKSINDSAGHAGGDRALIGMGRLIRGVLRKVDFSFRTGGDEFALLLPHTDAEGARIVARRLLAGALSPMGSAHEKPITISFSAGVSTLPDLATTRAQLYSQADAALYIAKRGGRTDVAIFDPGFASDADGSAGSAVAEVLARGLLRPAYQPIMELATGVIIGYEGLIRPVPPAPFTDPGALFAAAEASGRLGALDMACIETLLAGSSGIAADQFLSLNLSPLTLEAPEFSSVALLSVLARHGFPPERLVIELTERQPLTDVGRVRAKVDALRRAGVRLAADDIGAGNAGLRLLSELRFEVLKVDLSLVRRSAPGAPSGALMGSVVEFGARTGALVVAEGIEDERELGQVTALGVKAGQGFLLGRPGPLPEAAGPRAAAVDPGEVAAWRQSIGLPAPAMQPIPR